MSLLCRVYIRSVIVVITTVSCVDKECDPQCDFVVST